MTNIRRFDTVLLWHDSRGGEVECQALVSYIGHKGFAGDRINPPEPASVEIESIVATDGETAIPDSFFESEDLMIECFEHWSEDEIAAAEYRAEQRAERLWEDMRNV